MKQWMLQGVITVIQNWEVSLSFQSCTLKWKNLPNEKKQDQRSYKVTLKKDNSQVINKFEYGRYENSPLKDWMVIK